MTTPYKFQAEDVAEAIRRGSRVGLCHDPGLGKTLMSLMVARQHLERDDPIVVVCPAYLKENWRRQVLEHTGCRAAVIGDEHRPEWGLPPCTDKIWIINYERLRPRVRRMERNPAKLGWVERLKEVNPGTVIIDEIVYVMNPRAKRTRAVRLLCEGVEHVLELGGTGGINSKPIQLWAPLNIIRPDLFPNYYAFGMRYCDPKRRMGDIRRKDGRRRRVFFGWEFNGATNLSELHKILFDGPNAPFIRRRKEDVLEDLPPKTRVIVPVEFSRKEMGVYRTLLDDYVDWLVKVGGPDAVKGKLLAVERQTLSELKVQIGKLKLPTAIEWTRTFLEEGRKLIVYGVHRNFVCSLHEQFPDSVLVHGGIVGKKRQLAFDRFNDDPDCKLMACNIDAGGMGWSCTSCDDVMHAEFAWVPASHLQGTDRVRGINRGTGRPVTEYWLAVMNTVDETLCKIIEKKKGVIDQILDGKKHDDMAVFTELRNAIWEGGKCRADAGRSGGRGTSPNGNGTKKSKPNDAKSRKPSSSACSPRD